MYVRGCSIQKKGQAPFLGSVIVFAKDTVAWGNIFCI